MRFAYADPPYLGCGIKHYAKHHPDAAAWDDIAEHQRLVERLMDEFPDGWAMSTGSSQLQRMLKICPDDVRIGAWVKGFVFFKPGVNPAYAWEPVIFRGGRPVARADRGSTTRDWVAAHSTFRTGLAGSKPRKFCRFLFEMLNAKPGDDMVDLFPGTGSLGAAWQEWTGEQTAQISLFERISA